eukprot:300128_1
MHCIKHMQHTLLHIIWIILLHIHTTHSFAIKLPPHHATVNTQLTTTTELITTNTNDNIAIIETPKQNTNKNTNTNKPITITTTTTTPSPTPDNPNMPCGSTHWQDTNTNNSTTYITYTVEIYKLDTSPILSYINHTSIYKQVFNPSWIPKSSNVPHAGLMVQVQNCSLIPGHCTYCNSSNNNSTADIVYTPCDAITGRCDTLNTPSSQIAYNKNESLNFLLKDTIYNSNPSIFYWNNMYYLFKNTFNSHKNTLSLYTTTTPRNITSWKQKDAFPSNNKITGPSSLLPRNISHINTKHYLFFGGEGYIS